MDTFTTTARVMVYAATLADMYDAALEAGLAFADGGTLDAVELEGVNRTAVNPPQWGATAVLTVTIPVEPLAPVS